VTNAQAEDDLRRTTKSGSDTVSFLNILLWIVAAGIVASIVYLNALERTRDFAVLKATGSSNRSIVGGLAVQATVLTVLAAVLAIGIAFALKPGFPFPVTLSGGSVAKIVVVAIVVGLLASLVGVRRAVSTDPAIAIGGA
jgi:putative ABC transport system permease protein